RDPVRGEGAVHRYREGDADGEADVDESDRRGAAPTGEEKRARSQERRGQQGPGGVVDAKGTLVPAGGFAPRDRGSRHRAGREPHASNSGRPLAGYRAPSCPASRRVNSAAAKAISASMPRTVSAVSDTSEFRHELATLVRVLLEETHRVSNAVGPRIREHLGV